MHTRVRALLMVLLATAGVVTIALCVAGWRLVAAQREIDRQRAERTLQESADSLAITIRGRLTDAGDALGAWLFDPSADPVPVAGAVALAIDAEGTRVVPPGGLPFVPVAAPEAEAAAFDEIEEVEFRFDDPETAARRYRTLARSADPRLRAGALVRLGRALRRTDDLAGALEAYEQLGTLGNVRTAGLPAELAALLGRRALLEAQGDRAGLDAANALLQQGLDAGRWALTRAQAEYYRELAATHPPPPAWTLAAAASDVWQSAAGRLAPRGQRTMLFDDRAVVLIWRASAMRTVLTAAFLDDMLAPTKAAGLRWRLVDADAGRPLAGDGDGWASSAAARVISAEYPWTLEVASRDASPSPGSASRLLAAGLAITLVFVWAATYFIARAIRREADVSRLQADFVAAVSHEFRSPLTTVRQLAELLESNRLRTDDRRRLYYGVIAGEAARLQRLVETLLNFGRIEAGAERYQLAPVEASAIVRSVTEQTADQAREAGVHIEITGPDAGALVRGDEAALGVALRNLIDNAIKYSPGAAAVRVEWEREGDVVAIRVVDAGLGIPRSEQAAVFRKFVRGQSAARANVRGTGVGLAMVQRIVAAHGGEVRLDSEVGRGSTFTLRLPAAQAAPQDARLTA